MEFNFKIQPYQTDAVQNIVDVFDGEAFDDNYTYVVDGGSKNRYLLMPKVIEGYSNHPIGLSDSQILENIKKVQARRDIHISKELDEKLGRCSLDIEMETGTGKTYVYIKTIFELNRRYGWSKFIIVVPSIAIREGVSKSFEVTKKHFTQYYNREAEVFIYDSAHLEKIQRYSTDSGINVMIINSQAFASSLKEDGKSKESRIIYTERDDFESRRPIDVIAANNPIIILDEPQKLSGRATQDALKKNFNILFSLNFSATHRVKHNLIYSLDALDAYNHKLVKKIEVKGIETRNLTGSSCYIYLDQILVDSKLPPRARIEMDISHSNGIRREIRTLDDGDDLYEESNKLEEYKGIFIADINNDQNYVELSNGLRLFAGEVSGDDSEGNLRRIQIRETIVSHFEKEQGLFKKGIKCLSLFFIDQVDNYRRYNESGDPVLGPYGQMFENEYNYILEQMMPSFEPEYRTYLESISIESTHKGYFSIDKRTKHVIDSPLKGKSESSDDVDAYDLILRDKERLLSFDEPTRFIFSHSALSEGWDNPNVFQICALKHSDSTVRKRQEVGRGLRLCVNSAGERMDLEECGGQIHEINTLTVVASEGYDSFVRDLQKEISQVLRDRPTKVSLDLIRKIRSVDDADTPIPAEVANRIYHELDSKGLIDYSDKPTEKSRKLLESEPEPIIFEEGSDLEKYNKPIRELLRASLAGEFPKGWVNSGKGPRITDNRLNENFEKKEFKALWNEINHKYVYTVDFDSQELIDKSLEALNELKVRTSVHVIKTGIQKDELTNDEVKEGNSFGYRSQQTESIGESVSSVKYDLVGEIAGGSAITRHTAVEILKNMDPAKFSLYQKNPEEFIKRVCEIIKDQRATMIIDHITYNRLDETYDSDIFTKNQSSCDPRNAYRAARHITDYVFTDGLAEESIEKRFAEALDKSKEVVVYAKLPSGFQIPTPVGNYTPDWAIALNEDTNVKHIYFIAETKGTMDSFQLRSVEKAKIHCAKQIFNVDGSKVHYECVTDYATLLDILRGKES